LRLRRRREGSSDEKPAEGKPAEGRSRRALGTGVAIIAAISGGLALLFQISPDLTPDPRTKLAGQIRVVAVDREVTLREYQQRIRDDTKDFSRDLLRSRGYVVYLDVKIQGRKHRSVRLLYSLYDARTRRRVRGFGDVEPLIPFQADTPDDEFVAQIFVQHSGIPRQRVVVRFELRDRETILAVTDTDPLPPIRAPRGG
jgi:hypothetical protein